MTTEEKLKYFMEITIQDSSCQGESIVSDYKKSLDQLFEEHQKDALRQAEFQVKVEKERAKREANIELTRQQLHIKRKISRKQSALKDQLFDEVMDLIYEFMKTDAYTEQLIKQINQAKAYAGNQYIVIYIDPKDTDKKEHLESVTGMTLKVSEYSFVGGIRTVIPYKNILIDDSYEKKITSAKENYVFGGSSNE